MALHDALAMWVEAGKLERIPLTGQVAAISMGVVDGNTLLDLDYSEDSHAEVDMNLVATDSGEMIELQVPASRRPSTASVSTPCSIWATRASPSSSSFSVKPSPNLPKGDVDFGRFNLRKRRSIRLPLIERGEAEALVVLYTALP